ncbi:MAG: metallophosphoesterase family protein [Thermodesulfovibrionia bacterium]|nr:metallophosphoesterase family protein [Thermodesulfovibrionia bacterium]
MRYALISDVHSNLEALNAVIEKVKADKVDKVIILGDIVGYGPDPNECIDTLRKFADILIAGNHDHGAVGMTDISCFNNHAKAAIQWTTGVLSEENKAFLSSLPLTSTIKSRSIYLVHSSPKEPEEWEYLQKAKDADANFKFFSETNCFIGHTHKPAIIEMAPGGKITIYPGHSEIKPGCRYIINAGSVGQPRDGNPDASYAIFDTDSVTIKRAAYDILLTQKKMKDAGLPSYLIDRLSEGR